MAKTLRGREVKLAVGQITNIEGVWFRVHKISKRDITFRRLNAEQVVNVERVKAAQERREAGCEGAGKCHGSMQWCDYCGDVSNVCDGPPCDAHPNARAPGAARPLPDG